MITYYTANDFFNLHSTDTLTILSQFQTVQQTTDYTCGAAAALMILRYYNVGGWTEESIADAMRIRPPAGKEKGIYGTSTRQLVSFFMSAGFLVESSLDRGEPYSFTDARAFRDWATASLKNGIPIMVEWLDWGGHWQVLIGIDTMGTEDISDTVLIFADPYDTSDHHRDGYYIFGLERFFSMWMDAQYFYEEESVQQWVIATPKEEHSAIFYAALRRRPASQSGEAGLCLFA